jgi:protein-S-isoprenylcysteine O-methyltransferase Ste14
LYPTQEAEHVLASMPSWPPRWPAVTTLLAWGAVEMALRLRLALRPGLRRWASSWTHVRRRRLGDWTFYVVVISVAAAVIASLLLARVGWAATGSLPAVIVAGELVAVAGVALRVWAIMTLDRLFTFVVGIADDHQVVQEGPYRLLRHPGYAGVLLTLLGVGIALQNWLSLLILCVVPAAALGVRIAAEEAVLAGALGAEYVAYANRTARLLPGIW